MQEVDWAKLHYLGKGLLALDNSIAKEVFLSENFKHKKENAMHSLSVSISKNYRFKESIRLKDEVDALSSIEQEELIRLLIVQSLAEENDCFNPVGLVFIDDNLFNINNNYLKVLGKVDNNFYFSTYAEKIISKNNLKVITKNSKNIINSENFIFSNILNAIVSLKVDWSIDGLLKDRYNFNTRDKYLNGKKVMNDLIDFILESNLSLKAIHEETLWISKYKEFFDEASVEEMNVFAKRVEKVLTTPIKEKNIYFLKNLLNSIDYYEVGVKDNQKKVTYMLNKNMFDQLYVENKDCLTVDVDKLFKIQLLTVLASVNQDNMSNYILGDKNNLITEAYIALNGLVKSNVALYNLYCFENTVLSNSFIQEHFKEYTMNIVLAAFKMEKKDVDITSLVNEFIKENKVNVEVCHLIKLKVDLLNNIIQNLGAKSITFNFKVDNGKFAIFNKEDNNHINLDEVFKHLFFNRFSEKEDYIENLEIKVQHNLMKTENILSKSTVKGRLLKF